ncbi:MAG: serine hydrolase [Candidatus Harrisonbacteria bacterium]|nr:serine hydrolase [Candidatus Harrisonbacteria bacterium]
MSRAFVKQLFLFSALVLSVSAWFYFSSTQARDLTEQLGPNILEASIENNISPQIESREKLSNKVAAAQEPIQEDANDEPAVFVSAQDSQSEKHQLSAVIAIAKELDFVPPATLEEQYHQRWPMASITKLMTAAIALEAIGSDTVITISAEAVANEGAAGAFNPSEQFSVSDLVKTLMMVSSNDAAAALAEHMGRDAFVLAMEEKARDIGMSNTQFVDPSGLSYLNQSTVSDLEKLFAYIYDEHPEIFAFSREKISPITELVSATQRELASIIEIGSQPDFIGGKTGYIDEAGGNFLALFQGSSEPVMVAVLGSQNRFQDALVLYQQYQQQQ